ncbi:MAG: type I methionyl aminopeptidase [Gammaproteobacteria bacterium RIFCSPHIGHO2_12_FULL_45_12]|nr:MAG: type I methionyl aminopeptidase [Gammaproteobacteria bacterium RIFCSPHIGHO2_12_FULL_45_12]
MSHLIKSQELIEKMRVSARLAVSVLEMIEPHVKPGVTTNELNDICHRYMVHELKCVPAPLGYHGFPKSICTSLNRVVCHGIPDDKPLKSGDILNIDISLSKDGAYADTCKMFLVGECSIQSKRIVKCAQEAIYAAIAIVKPGISLRDIGRAISIKAREYGYSIVRDFCGHGIGESLHEAPQVLHYDSRDSEHFILQAGMTFTIEPMINVGRKEVSVLKDGWTVVTKDHSLSAQYEHTLLVTETGFDILTLRKEESLTDIMAHIA